MVMIVGRPTHEFPYGEVREIVLEPVPVYWLWGWKAIGEAAGGKSWRWAQKWGERNRAGRMPVAWVDKRPVITAEDLHGWIRSRVRTAHIDEHGDW